LLYRTVHVEEFAHGLRLSATDTYMLLESWVPERDFDLDPAPDRDELPERSAVAVDEYGRASNLLAHLLKLTTADDIKPIDMSVRLGVPVVGPAGGDALSFDGMDATAVVLEHPDHERVQLATCDGAYPSFQPLLDAWKPVRTDAIALNPVMVTKLAKVAKLHGDVPIKWRWGGNNKPAAVEMGSGEPLVSGLVMPSRWDFERNSPLGGDE